MSFFQVSVFLVGILVGIFLALLVINVEEEDHPKKHLVKIPFDKLVTLPQKEIYRMWSNQYVFNSINSDQLSFTDTKHHLESDLLYNKVKLTCVVIIKKEKNAFAMAYTWPKRCNSALFYSEKRIPYLEVRVILKPKSSWYFLCEILRTVADQDWVLFSNDDIFVIPENLRYNLVHLDPQAPYYFGHNVLFWNQLYNSAKTAYVLSKGAIQMLTEKFNSSNACTESGKGRNNEDYLLGQHLYKMGVRASDTRDFKGRHRYHLFTPMQLMAEGNFDVIQKYSARSLYPVVQGKQCCSPTSVAFQGTEGDLIIFYNFLLYKVKLFQSFGGLANNLTKASVRSDDVWIKFTQENLGLDYNISLMTDKKYYDIWDSYATPEVFNKKIKEEFTKSHEKILGPDS